MSIIVQRPLVTIDFNIDYNIQTAIKKLDKILETTPQGERQRTLKHTAIKNKFSISPKLLAFALTEQIDRVVEAVLQHFKTDKQSLNQKASTYLGIYPIHVATMINRLDYVSKLADAGADLNVRDNREWTPLHHAALGGYQKIIDFLCGKGVDQTALTDTEGTYQDIIRLTERPSPDPTANIPVLFREENGSTQPLTYAKFQELTGAQYLEENWVDRKWMALEWGNKETEDLLGLSESIHQLLKQRYAGFFSNRPQHILQKDKQGHFGLFTSANFEEGDILGEFISHIGPEDKTPYTLAKNRQALKYRNEIPVASDGFPNALMIEIPNFKGLAIRYVLTACTSIKAGEQICYSFSNFHIVKQGPYIEHRGQALRDFVNHCDLKLIAVCFNLLKKDKNCVSKLSLKQHTQVMQFYYIIQTPAVLFNMVWDGSVNPTKLKAMLDIYFDSSSKTVLKNHVHVNQIKLIDLAEACYEIQKELKPRDSKAASHFSNYVEKKIKELGPRDLLEHLDKLIPPILQKMADNQIEELSREILSGMT